MEGKEIAKVLTETPKVLEKVYGDLAQPGVKKVGTALATVLDLSNTILLPIKLLNEKARLNFKKHMDCYKSKLDNENTDNIGEVPPEIGSPILDKFSYVTNEEIGEMFANLLHKASTLDKASQAHPSFVQLIDRLSVDEARILNFLKSRTDIPCMTVRAHTEKQGFHDIVELATGLEHCLKLDFPNNTYTYIDNFRSMGVLSIDPSLHKINDDYYKHLMKFYEPLKDSLEKDTLFKRIEFKRSYFKITNFGRMFIQACTSQNEKKTA